MSGISFGFTKKKENAVKNRSIIDETVEDNEERDFIKVVDDKHIVSVKKKDDTGPLVIPMIAKNKWRNVNKSSGSTITKDTEPEDSAKSAAVRELLADAKRFQEGPQEDKDASTLEIPLLMQNVVPEGYETDDKISTDIRPEESTLEEYGSVPIEHFGMAILRGMGWKEGDGIGRNKKHTPPVEATLRPKGMGLGADKSAILQDKNQGRKPQIRKPGDNQEEIQLSFKTGVNCVITKKGEYMDLYATIQGLDEDNSRCVVKLALSGANVTLSQLHVRLVNKSEFDKYSRYINKGKTDEYKKLEAMKARDRDDTPTGEKRPHKPKSNGGDVKRSKIDPDARRHEPRGWIRSHLRVKIVDKKYKDGKYYSTKVEVEDVLPNSVTCRTDSDRLLEGLTESQLETVIPRGDKGLVMIVERRRPHAGSVGEILGRDKHKQQVTVQILPDRDDIETYSYDDVCEYTGTTDLL